MLKLRDLSWHHDLIRKDIGDNPYLLGWADEDDDLQSESYPTLNKAVAALKALTGNCFRTAFIEDRRLER